MKKKCNNLRVIDQLRWLSLDSNFLPLTPFCSKDKSSTSKRNTNYLFLIQNAKVVFRVFPKIIEVKNNIWDNALYVNYHAYPQFFTILRLFVYVYFKHNISTMLVWYISHTNKLRLKKSRVNIDPMYFEHV